KKQRGKIMRKIHVITQKELIREKDLKHCTAVVIDVFLATSTIAFLLNKNYHEIYATKSVAHARKYAREINENALLLGEINGNPVDGFVYPDPTLIEKVHESKSAIISSTNGTIAI